METARCKQPNRIIRKSPQELGSSGRFTSITNDAKKISFIIAVFLQRYIFILFTVKFKIYSFYHIKRYKRNALSFINIS